jgi:hypothetical protein
MKIILTRPQKILLTLFDLSSGTTKKIRFEDIAVRAFEKYKSDFQLRGYPQHPDTGDIVHKPLYSELKKHGYVLSGNKYFSLTPKGIEYAKNLLKHNKEFVKSDDSYTKFTMDQQKEIERIKDTDAFKLFYEGKKDEILDIDFYSYLGVTVRTNKFDFLGRLATVEDAISATENKSKLLYSELVKCHSFLKNKFKENLDFIKNSKGGGR